MTIYNLTEQASAGCKPNPTTVNPLSKPQNSQFAAIEQ